MNSPEIEAQEKKGASATTPKLVAMILAAIAGMPEPLSAANRFALVSTALMWLEMAEVVLGRLRPSSLDMVRQDIAAPKAELRQLCGAPERLS